MLGPSPFALAAPSFRFRALAVAAGRAAIGGPREVLMGVLVAARLTASLVPPRTLSAPQRRARADAARNWLGTIALPAAPKLALTRLVDATLESGVEQAAVALAKVTDVTAPYLDKAARSELDSLARSLAR